MPKKKNSIKVNTSLWEKINSNTNENQSRLSMVLGALIILVIGILVFNYFSKQKPSLGPSQTTELTQEQDVAPANLPGKYTVKEGDTLFTISEKYYQDGNKYTDLASANNIADVNIVETGRVLDIPKLADAITTSSPSPQPSVEAKQAANQPNTQWGPAITTNTYTVAEGDWLSKIADRAYGDIFAFNKIAQANNIQNPDLIEPGMVLKIPR